MSTFAVSADEYKISGAHLTFNLPEEGDALEDLGFLRRTGIQYHWSNNDYGCFDDFLADLKQSKRNNIRKVSLWSRPPMQQAAVGERRDSSCASLLFREVQSDSSVNVGP